MLSEPQRKISKGYEQFPEDMRPKNTIPKGLQIYTLYMRSPQPLKT